MANNATLGGPCRHRRLRRLRRALGGASVRAHRPARHGRRRHRRRARRHPLRLGGGRPRAALGPQHRRHAAPRLLARRDPGAAHRLSDAVRRRDGTFAERVDDVAAALSRRRARCARCSTSSRAEFIARPVPAQGGEWRRKLGILAGAGELPLRVDRGLPRRGPSGLRARASRASPIRAVVAGVPHAWVRLGAGGEGMRLLRENGVDGARAGRRRAPALARGAAARLARGQFFARIGAARAWATTACCAPSSRELEGEGFRVVGVDSILGDALAPPGALGALAPDDGGGGRHRARHRSRARAGRARCRPGRGGAAGHRAGRRGGRRHRRADRALRRAAARGAGRRAGQDRQARPGAPRRSAGHRPATRSRRPRRRACAASRSRPARRCCSTAPAIVAAADARRHLRRRRRAAP